MQGLSLSYQPEFLIGVQHVGLDHAGNHLCE
jgi:hypothetical protein